jgi:hypothetical protein
LCQRGQSPADAAPRLAGVRAMFVIYLSGIFLGLAYCIVIGLTHH